MKFGLCVLGYRQGGPAGLRPDGWRTVKLCHVAPGCCRCWCWWWWRDAKLGLNIHNNSTGARTRCCGAVVLWCCGAGHHHTHSCVWCCLHCYRRSTVTTHLHLSSGTSSLIKLGLPASTNISTTQQCAHNLTMYNHGQKRSAPYKRSLQTINMLLDHEGCDTVL